jgi:predicted membrane protein
VIYFRIVNHFLLVRRIFLSVFNIILPLLFILTILITLRYLRRKFYRRREEEENKKKKKKKRSRRRKEEEFRNVSTRFSILLLILITIQFENICV